MTTMTINNPDLIALLTASLTGDREGIGPLIDAIKEAGQEETAEKLLKLLLLHEKVTERLEKSRKLIENEDLGLTEGMQEDGFISALENVLRWIGEEIPPYTPPSCCECCGMPAKDCECLDEDDEEDFFCEHCGLPFEDCECKCDYCNMPIDNCKCPDDE